MTASGETAPSSAAVGLPDRNADNDACFFNEHDQPVGVFLCDMTLAVNKNLISHYFIISVLLSGISMKGHVLLSFLLVLCLASGPLMAQEGESLFKTNCAACHSIGKGKLVGPDLKNVIDRHTEDWLRKWIRSSQSLVKSGDADAVKLFKDNMEIVMPDQTISDADIQQIVDYFKTHPGGEVKKPIAHNEHEVGEHGHPLANPENHLAIQEKEHTLVSNFGFGGYLGMMLGGLALVIVLVVLLAFKARSQSGSH